MKTIATIAKKIAAAGEVPAVKMTADEVKTAAQIALQNPQESARILRDMAQAGGRRAAQAYMIAQEACNRLSYHDERYPAFSRIRKIANATAIGVSPDYAFWATPDNLWRKIRETSVARQIAAAESAGLSYVHSAARRGYRETGSWYAPRLDCVAIATGTPWRGSNQYHTVNYYR